MKLVIDIILYMCLNCLLAKLIQQFVSPGVINVQIIMPWQQKSVLFCFKVCLLVLKIDLQVFNQRQSLVDNFKQSNLAFVSVGIWPLSGFTSS